MTVDLLDDVGHWIDQRGHRLHVLQIAGLRGIPIETVSHEAGRRSSRRRAAARCRNSPERAPNNAALRVRYRQLNGAREPPENRGRPVTPDPGSSGEEPGAD